MAKKDKFTRIVEMLPAFDKRHIDPSKNYGIRGVELRMILKGAKGAVQFVLYTNWQLPHVTDEYVAKPIRSAMDIKARWLPLPADVGWHSLEPQYSEQSKQDKCPYLDNKPCYYDGSALMADDMFKILCEEGSDGVWADLEKKYIETYETSK